MKKSSPRAQTQDVIKGPAAVIVILVLVMATPASAQHGRGLSHWEGRRLSHTFNRHAAQPGHREGKGSTRQTKVWRKGDLSHAFNGTRPREQPAARHQLNPPHHIGPNQAGSRPAGRPRPKR